MIKYNNNTINDWFYSSDNIIKVYRNNAVCYYKIDSSSPSGQTPCYAVVEDISQYSDTEFEDVFNKADDKWYKLNNLNQYEEYGIYGSGRTITYYEGKLTIDDGYEYQYSGASWNNVGEVSGSSRLPQGYTEVEYVENTTQAYLNLGVYPYSSSSNSYAVEAKFSSTQGTNQFEYLFSCEQGNLSPYVGFICRWQTTRPRGLVIDGTNYTSKNITNNQDGTSGFTITSNLTNATNTTPITLFCGLQGSTVWRNGKGKVYSFKVTINDNLVRDMIPCKRDNDNVVGMYDIVNDVFYYPPNYTSYQLVAGSATGTTIYPIYYDVIQDPPNNLSFSSMTEAEEYECPWVGMNATIDGVNYVFSGDSQSGYEWVEKQTDWYTLQDLINTHTVVSLGNNKYNFSPEVNGIAFFRVHTDKVSGSNTFVDLYNDNLPSPPYFGIKDDSNITLYTSVDGYSNLKSAANSSTCTWAYWIDANTIEVNAQAIMNDTMKIGYYNGSFSKLLLSFELPII